jgi:hypothetical protein
MRNSFPGKSPAPQKLDKAIFVFRGGLAHIKMGKPPLHNLEGGFFFGIILL